MADPTATSHNHIKHFVLCFSFSLSLDLFVEQNQVLSYFHSFTDSYTQSNPVHLTSQTDVLCCSHYQHQMLISTGW